MHLRECRNEGLRLKESKPQNQDVYIKKKKVKMHKRMPLVHRWSVGILEKVGLKVQSSKGAYTIT